MNFIINKLKRFNIKTIFNKNYNSESLYDLSRDIYELLNDKLNFSFKGTINVKITLNK